jgi:integrase
MEVINMPIRKVLRNKRGIGYRADCCVNHKRYSKVFDRKIDAELWEKTIERKRVENELPEFFNEKILFKDLAFGNGNNLASQIDNFYKYHFLKDIKKAGIKKIRFHDLRHTFASHYIINGGSLDNLQLILGHSNQQITRRYAHLTPGYLRDKMEVVNFCATNNTTKYVQNENIIKLNVCNL